MLTPNYTYCAIIKFRWIVLGGRPGLAREAEKISTRFEMDSENKKRKLFKYTTMHYLWPFEAGNCKQKVLVYHAYITFCASGAIEKM